MAKIIICLGFNLSINDEMNIEDCLEYDVLNFTLNENISIKKIEN